jgi:anti-sigma factor RsiW
MKRDNLELLYRSFDSRLTQEEAQRLEEALSESEELRSEKERIIAMRETLASDSARGFSPLFPERVMGRIRALEEKEAGEELFFESLYRMFRPIALAAAAAAVTSITLNLRESDDYSLSAAFAAQEESIDNLMQTPLESFLEESQ